MFTSNVLSVPFIVMDTELVATLPFAVVNTVCVDHVERGRGAAAIRSHIRSETALASPFR